MTKRGNSIAKSAVLLLKSFILHFFDFSLMIFQYYDNLAKTSNQQIFNNF